MRLSKQAKSDAGYMLRCGLFYEDQSEAGKKLRSIPSDKRAEASRANGKLGGRPRYCDECGSEMDRSEWPWGLMYDCPKCGSYKRIPPKGSKNKKEAHDD